MLVCWRDADQAAGEEGGGGFWTAWEDEEEGEAYYYCEDALDWEIINDSSFLVIRRITSQHLLRKIHCHPESPCRPSSWMMPEARMGDSAFPENIPKKKMATRLASSFCRYHVDSVYTAPGM